MHPTSSTFKEMTSVPNHSSTRHKQPTSRRLAEASRLAQPRTARSRRIVATIAAANLAVIFSINLMVTNAAAQTAASVPYENMPKIAPPGVRIGKHIDIPESAKGPPVDCPDDDGPGGSPDALAGGRW